MNRRHTSIILMLLHLLICGCVAGGSGAFVEAKKNGNRINLRLTYAAYGGANLKKLKICEISYGSSPGHKLSRKTALEFSRKVDRIEWITSIHTASQSGKIFISSHFHTKNLIGRDTPFDWTIKLSELNSNYKHISSGTL